MSNRVSPRFVAISALCLLLALGLAGHALSSVATRSAPEQAVTLFPANGLAREQLAFRSFLAQAIDVEKVSGAARSVESQAREGLRNDALAPKSLAILAMSEDDPATKRAILSLGNKLNRRDISLQGLVLQEHLANEDYRGVVTTLDQLLRVHPEFYDEFFPLLVNVIKIDEASILFPSILTGETAWHEQFLLVASREREAQMNLARIRDDLAIKNAIFDRTLISGLAWAGETERALEIYQSVHVPTSGLASANALDWTSDYPPFDWNLANETDFRAQPSRDGLRLELYARSGQGGLAASRILPAPSTPFAIETELALRAAGRSDRVRISVSCGAQTETVNEAVLDTGANTILIEALPPDCEFVRISIRARALRAEPTLRAELSPVTISPL